MGCGSVAATGEFLVDDSDLTVKSSVARIMPIATTFGLSIVVLAFAIGPISGGHINPVVGLVRRSSSSSFVLSGIILPRRGPPPDKADASHTLLPL